MVKALDIALAAHDICIDELIPKGISPTHNFSSHLDTSGHYADKINEAGLNVTGKDVVNAIFTVTKWDKVSKWPGHPVPKLVIKELKGIKP